MNDLTVRLEALLRLYASTYDGGNIDTAGLAEQFRKDLRLLVAEYGSDAVDAALDEVPNVALPSVSLQ
jgi:hypothetical protein